MHTDYHLQTFIKPAEVGISDQEYALLCERKNLDMVIHINKYLFNDNVNLSIMIKELNEKIREQDRTINDLGLKIIEAKRRRSI